MKYLLTTAIFSFFLSTSAAAQQSAATVFGHVHLSDQSDADNILFGMQEANSATMTEVDQPDTNGDFEFPSVPFGSYDLYLREQNHSVFIERIVINSPVPIHITLDSVPNLESTTTAPNWNIKSAQSEVHTLHTVPEISTLPVANTAYGIEALQVSSPGIVPGENNRLFFRGENSGPEYIIDGIPVTNQESRTTMPLFEPRLIESADLIRGNLDPQYGSNGVLNINTKSGFDATSFGHAEYSIGTLGNSSTGVDLGGRLGNAFAYYGSYGSYGTNQFLDPLTNNGPNHTTGSGSDYFGKINILASDDFTITALGYYGATIYQVPNASTSSSQDQDNSIIATMFGGRIDYDVSSTSILSLLGYTRRQSSSYTSNGITRINDSATLATARLSDDYFIGATSENFETGGQLSYAAQTDWFGAPNNFTIAAEGEIIPMQQYLTFAVTNTAVSDSGVGDPHLIPYDLTKGGNPFLVDTSVTGKRISAYAEDRILAGAWTISGGLRYDLYNLVDNESGLSPRLNLSYKACDALTLRASYNRLFEEAPLENILVSSSAEAAALMGTTQGAVQGEKSNNFELGANYLFSRYWSMDLTGYYKIVDNMLITTDLDNSGILLTANIKNATIYGGELELDLRDWNHFYGNLTVSAASSQGAIPADGSSPFGAGLIVGGAWQSYMQSYIGQSTFATQQTEPLAASFTLRYDHPSGYFLQVAGRFDSGLPFGYIVQPQNPNASNAVVSPPTDAVQNLVDLNSNSPEQSIAPHATFDFSAGYNLGRFGLPVTISADVINIFNTQYLTEYEPVYDGAHYGLGRTFLVKGELTP